MSEYESIKITQSRGETLIFEGKCLADFTTEKPGKPDFQEFYLYETAKGTWVAVMDVHVRGSNFTTATVVEAGGDPRLPQEPLLEVARLPEGAPHGLDGDQPVEHLVASHVDDAERALAQDALDGVLAPEPRPRVRHAGLTRGRICR